MGHREAGSVGTAGRNHLPPSLLLPVTSWELSLMAPAVRKVFKVGSWPWLGSSELLT